MKILYVILTCEKYLNTRVKWQKETWAKDQPCVYLSNPPEGEEETYKNAPKKYIDLFRNCDNYYFNSYDWVFFCDDDTFVYTEKLETYFAKHNMNIASDYASIMIGFVGGNFSIHSLKITWCSGGAGIALSRSAVKAIQTHLRNTPNPLVTHETDISLAIWATMATENLTVIDSKRFSPFNSFDAEKEKLKDCITYHYCTENDFIRLGKEL